MKDTLSHTFSALADPTRRAILAQLDQILTTVTLTREETNQTRVTVQWEILGGASKSERKTFHEMKPSMTGGWNGSFDQLEELLFG